MNHTKELSTAMETFTTKVQEANENGKYIEQSPNDVLEMTKNDNQLMQSSSGTND